MGASLVYLDRPKT